MNESAENLGQKYRTLFEIIREFESLIECAVILSPDPDLRVSLSALKRSLDSSSGSDSTKTLEEAEREHILKVLQETKWVVGGPSGAAIRLGLKRTTLQARMQKLALPAERDIVRLRMSGKRMSGKHQIQCWRW